VKPWTQPRSEQSNQNSLTPLHFTAATEATVFSGLTQRNRATNSDSTPTAPAVHTGVLTSRDVSGALLGSFQKLFAQKADLDAPVVFDSLSLRRPCCISCEYQKYRSQNRRGHELRPPMSSAIRQGIQLARGSSFSKRRTGKRKLLVSFSKASRSHVSVP